MKWFGKLKRGHTVVLNDEPGERVVSPTSLDDARAARAQSEDALTVARAQDPAVRRLAQSLREHRHSNNFAGMLEVIFKGDR